MTPRRPIIKRSRVRNAVYYTGRAPRVSLSARGVHSVEPFGESVSDGKASKNKRSMNAAGDDDASLVARVLAGESEAYRVLVERYQRAVFSCAYQLLGSESDAEEAAQEAFVQAYEKLARLREPRYFFSWIWRICSTVALKWRMKARRAALGLDEESGAVSQVERPDAASRRGERDHALIAALSELPDEQREVLTLRFWEDMDYAEMAGLLGISHDALYQRASRGIRRLQEILGDDFPDDV